MRKSILAVVAEQAAEQVAEAVPEPVSAYVAFAAKHFFLTPVSGYETYPETGGFEGIS